MDSSSLSSLLALLQGTGSSGVPDELLKNLMGGAGGAFGGLGGAQESALPNIETAFNSSYPNAGLLAKPLNAVTTSADVADSTVIAAPDQRLSQAEYGRPPGLDEDPNPLQQGLARTPAQGPSQAEYGRPPGLDEDPNPLQQGLARTPAQGPSQAEYGRPPGLEEPVMEDYNLLQQGLAGLGLIDGPKPLSLGEQKLQAERQKRDAERAAAMARASQAIPKQPSSPKRSFSPGSLAFMPKAGQLAPIYGGLLAPRRG